MKRIATTPRLGLALVAALLLAPACGNKAGDAAPAATGAATPPAAQAPASPPQGAAVANRPASAVPAPAPAREPLFKRTGKPGEIPFDYPAVTTTAKAGDYVLVPSKHFVDDAFAKGTDQQTFIFYAARLVEAGKDESKVKTMNNGKDEGGVEETIPNSLIIPIHKGDKAKPGDVLLTWWQSGSGMQRSIVVAGGSETEPKVRHLDLPIDNPGGAALRDDTLKADSFQKIDGDWAPGKTVAAKDPSGYKFGIITGSTSDKVLVVGFAGRMHVYAKADCVQIPVAPSVKPGDTVFVPHLGAFYKGNVEKVDAAVGRVYTKFQFGSQSVSAGIPAPNVATSLAGI